MSSARQEYLQRVQAIIHCLENQSLYNDFINDRSLTPENQMHNLQAQLLRNGLAISIFCYLEDFIKGRISECIFKLSSLYTSFNQLPDLLKMRLTYLTLEGIAKRSFTLKNNSNEPALISFIQTEVKHISSTLSNNYTTSNYAFGWHKENINANDVQNIFKEFFINDIWRKVQLLSSHINSQIIDAKSDFTRIMKNRHRAAHVANAQTPITDLSDLTKSCFVMAFSIDYLITTSLKLIEQSNQDHQNSNYNFSTNLPTLRKVKFESDKWKLYSPSGHCLKVENDFENIFHISKQRLPTNQVLICFSKTNFLQGWEIN
ncbi:HEPN domain-containing protein [Acinetobacter schindleri]|uniref:HEPN domain-containing protein n=1 Tax=Acinetobacter schindleri TaxID=108981 RepID=UPI0032146D60